MTTKARAPVIKELHYTDEEIAEVKRIQTSAIYTKMKERVRAVLQGPMCCICSQIPNKRVEYSIDGITRVECWCNKHFPIYERNKDVSINEIAETYNCTIVTGTGTFGGPKEYE